MQLATASAAALKCLGKYITSVVNIDVIHQNKWYMVINLLIVAY